MTTPSDLARPLNSPETPPPESGREQRVSRQSEVPTSAEDWEAKRAIITKLYSEDGLRLQDVQRTLEVEHGFRASKRMYMTRIKRWNLCKNLRAEDKEALISNIVEARSENQSLDQVLFQGRPVKLDRVLRHCKAVLRKQNREALLRKDDAEGAQVASDAMPQLRAPDQIELFKARQRSSVVPEKSDPFFLDIPRTIRPGSDGTDVELLLHNASVLYSMTVTPSISSTDRLSDPADFWISIKSAIHFLKSQRFQLAWPLLNNACQTRIAVLMSAPALLLRELFSTISPVNTKMHSQVRLTILRYLGQLSRISLGIQHPLTKVLSQLELDTGTRHASEAGLRYLLSQCEVSTPDLANRNFDSVSQSRPLSSSAMPPVSAPASHLQQQSLLVPSHSDATPSQTHYVKTLRALINLHRRDYSLSSALALSQQLTEYTTAHLLPSHTFALDALMEHAHILSDMGDNEPALKMAHHILLTYQAVQGPSFPDSKACYCMEVLAEINQIIGNTIEEEKWLRVGLESAWKVRGGDASVMFVRAKLEHILETQGRTQEILDLRLKYPEQNIEVVQSSNKKG